MKLKMILGVLVMLSCDIFGMPIAPQKLSFLKAPRDKRVGNDLKKSVATNKNNNASSSSQGNNVSTDTLLPKGASGFQTVGSLDLTTNSAQLTSGTNKFFDKIQQSKKNSLSQDQYVSLSERVKSQKNNKSSEQIKSSEPSLSLSAQDFNNQQPLGFEGIYLPNSKESFVSQNPLLAKLNDQADGLPSSHPSNNDPGVEFKIKKNKTVRDVIHNERVNPLTFRQAQPLKVHATSASQNNVQDRSDQVIDYSYDQIFSDNNKQEVAQNKRVKVSLLKSQSPQDFFNNVGVTLQELVASLSNMSTNGWRKVLQYLYGQPKTPETLEAIKEIEFETNPMDENQRESSRNKNNVSNSQKQQLANVLAELPEAVNKRLQRIAAADQSEQAKRESASQISPVNTQGDNDLSLLVSQDSNGESKASVTVVSEQENFVSNQPLQTDGAVPKSQPKSFTSSKEITVVSDPMVNVSRQPEVMVANESISVAKSESVTLPVERVAVAVSAPVVYASSQPEVTSVPKVAPAVISGSTKSSVKNFVKIDVQAQEKSIIDKYLQEGISLEEQLRVAKKDRGEMAALARRAGKKGNNSAASDATSNLKVRIELLQAQIKQEKINQENIKKQEGVLPGVGENFKSKDSLMGRNPMSKSQPNKLDLSQSPNSIAPERDKITGSNPMGNNPKTKSSPGVSLAQKPSLVKEMIAFWGPQGSKKVDKSSPSDIAGMNQAKSSLKTFANKPSAEIVNQVNDINLDDLPA